MAHLSRDPVEHAAYMRAWYARHPASKAAQLAAHRSNRRAAAMGTPGRVTGADVLALWERQLVCVTCGHGRGIDHVVALADGGPHDVGNLQTMCKPCNRAKEHVAARARRRHVST